MVLVAHGEDHDENRQRVYDWSTSAKHFGRIWLYNWEKLIFCKWLIYTALKSKSRVWGPQKNCSKWKMDSEIWAYTFVCWSWPFVVQTSNIGTMWNNVLSYYVCLFIEQRTKTGTWFVHIRLNMAWKISF